MVDSSRDGKRDEGRKGEAEVIGGWRREEGGEEIGGEEVREERREKLRK